ncbi:hypothetical protein GCM10027578_34930 [Spirosoma luteolum]
MAAYARKVWIDGSVSSEMIRNLATMKKLMTQGADGHLLTGYSILDKKIVPLKTAG